MKTRTSSRPFTYLLLPLGALFLAGLGCDLQSGQPSQDAVNKQVADVLTANPPDSGTPPIITVLVPVQVTVEVDEAGNPWNPSTIIQPGQPRPTNTRMSTPLTPTLTETPIPTATATLTPTATLLPADPKAGLGEPGWRDNMGAAVNWRQFDDKEQFSFTVHDNALYMKAYQANNIVNWNLASINLKNFYLEFVFNVGDCQQRDAYGIAFRAPDVKNAYLLGVTCDGQWSLRRWEDDKQIFVYQVNWVGSPAINAGLNQTNRLGIWAQDGKLGVYINDVLVGGAVDFVHLEGRFGPFIASNVTKKFTVTVTEASYWVLP